MTIQKQTEVKKQHVLLPDKASTAVNTIEERPESKNVESKMAEKRKQAIELSKFFTNNVLGSALVIDDLFYKKCDIRTIADYLSDRVDKVINGDIRSIESTLLTQAQVLDALFKQMLIRVTDATLLPHLQTYSEIALKAQTQARKTLALLAELKNPKRTTFIKKQNNAINQQVNFGGQLKDLEKSENKIPQSNELLIEAKTHEALEFGRAKETCAVDSQMEAMGKVDRSKDT